MALTLAGLAVAPVTDSLAASSPEARAQAYAHGRDAILTGLYLGGLAWSGAFLVFVAALYRDLRSRPDETTSLLATVALVGGAINAAAILGSLLFVARAAFEAGANADPTSIRRAHDASLLANNLTGFATAVCVGGFTPALRRIGSPLWLAAVGVWVALHHLASAGAMAREGFWSPGGPVSSTAPLGMTFWVGCVAVLAWRRSRR